MITAIKILHTIIWAVMASAVFYILYCGLTNTFNLWLWLSTGLIIFEGLILWICKGRCPLTAIATKYTPDRRSNFDIYLPEFIAKHNKLIFGTLYIIGLLIIVYNGLRSFLK